MDNEQPDLLASQAPHIYAAYGGIYMYVCIYIYIYTYAYICVCVSIIYCLFFYINYKNINTKQ